jgi:transcriptional accessory protein Tex/SPT6
MNFARQIPVQNSSAASVASEATTNTAAIQRTVETTTHLTDQQELQNLSQIIKTWRELNKETAALKEQVREKTKRLKALDEMILRIMKKHNIGALDLKESGGRILYRRAQSKEGLTPKNLMGLLSEHLKSEQAAADALKYIDEHRGAKVRESILYEH